MNPRLLLLVPAAIVVISAGAGFALREVLAEQDRAAGRATATVLAVPDRFGYRVSYVAQSGERCERYLKTSRTPRLSPGQTLPVLHDHEHPCDSVWDAESGGNTFFLVFGGGVLFALVITFLGWRAWRSPPTPPRPSRPSAATG
jgi:hypothetical protein